MSVLETTQTPIDELLLRLKSYFGKFSNEVAENILLRELYFIFTNIKAYVDQEVDEDNELDRLEERVNLLEEKTYDLKLAENSLKEVMDKVKDDFTLLESADNEIAYNLGELENEDLSINNLIKEIISSTDIEFGKLVGTDNHIKSTLDEGKELLETELNNRRNKLEDLDVNEINESILNLRESDISIKNNIDSNYQIETTTLETIDGRIEVEDILKDINDLKKIDITLNGSIDSLKSESEIAIVDLKEEDTRQREELTDYRNDIEKIEEDSQRGSEIALIGKMPIGKGNGFIDDDWIHYEESLPIGEWLPLERGLNSGSITAAIRSIALSGDVFVAGLYQGFASISTNRGRSWSSLPKGLNSGGTTYTILSMIASGDTFVAGLESGFASISKDKGKTWTALPKGLNSGSTTSDIISLATSDDIIVSGLESGWASISRNKGETWERLERGLNSESTRAISSLTANDSTFIAGFEGGNASISRDKGETWEPLERWLNSGGEGTIYSLASYGDVVVAGLAAGWASISRDKGETWEPLEQGLMSDSTDHIYSLCFNENVIIAGFRFGYASISEDTGETWEPLEKGLNSGNENSDIFAIHHSINTFIAGMDSGWSSMMIYSLKKSVI